MPLGRLCFIDTQLNDGHIRIGKNMAEYRPRSVIKSPLPLVSIYFYFEELLDASSKLGRTRRRILIFKKLAGKSAKIMDRSRPLHRRHRKRRNIPMGGNTKYRFRFWN